MSRLRLHPAHFQRHTLSTHKLSDWDVVWSGQSCLRVMSPSNEARPVVEIDLVLADAKSDWDSDFRQHVVIISPTSCPRHSNVQNRNITYDELKSRAIMAAVSDDTLSIPKAARDGNDGDTAPEFWILLIEGDDSAVHAILKRLGEAGAICWNLCAVLKVGRKIGSGTFSRVYRAKYRHADDVDNTGSKNAVVVKVLEPTPNCATAVEELDIIQHEITLSVSAGRHPNIVRFLGVFCLEDKDASMSADVITPWSSLSPTGLTPRWALVSEYVRGGDLHTAVTKQRFKEPCAFQVMADLLAALAHIHHRGIVHRDVKAENVLLSKHGKAVLADFGLAAMISDEKEMCKLRGSPGYAAPEVILYKRYGVKVDIFSAGVMLYFMLCGWLPFKGDSKKSCLMRTAYNEVSFDTHPEFFSVSSQCRHFILQLLQKNPHNRPTAEQAASQMWGSSDGFECAQHLWMSNAADGRSTSGLLPLRNHDLHTNSSRFPSSQRENGHADEGKPECGHRLGTNNKDGQASHTSGMDMEKGRGETSEPSIFEREAFRSETPHEAISILLPSEDKTSSAQPASSAHGGANYRTMRGQAGRLLQALRSVNAAEVPQTQIGRQGGQLASGSVLKVAPPASRPARPRPPTRSFLGWLSRGPSKQEDQQNQTDEGANGGRD